LKTQFSNQDFQRIQSEAEKQSRVSVPENLTDIWFAAELLISPELLERKKGFERLIELDAIKQNPIIIYLLASNLSEPDFSLRAFIVRVLSGLLDDIKTSKSPQKDPRFILTNYLSQISTEEVYSLLELAEVDPPSREYVVQLLCSCACAGDQLRKFVMDRECAINMRLIALEIIGKVGYLEVLPDLERLAKRLENRVNAEKKDMDLSEMMQRLNTTIKLLSSP
jgi:hypothetical protein